MATGAVSAEGKAIGRDGFRLRRAVELLLLLAILYTAAVGIARAMNGPAWAPLWQAVLLGSLLGWSAAALGFRPLRWAPVFLIAGAGFALISGGRLMEPVVEVALELSRLVGQFAAVREVAAVDTTALGGSLAGLSQAAGVVSDRVTGWVADWRSGAMVFDPVAASVLWAFSLWLVSVWAGWWLAARNQPFVSVAPAILLSVVTQTYTGTRFGGVHIMLGAALLLIAVVYHNVREAGWERAGIGFPKRLGWEVGKRAFMATAGIVLIAAIVPSVSLQELRDLFRGDGGVGSGSGSGIGESLGLEREEEEDPLEKLRRPGLPRDHLIGAGPELSEDLVMLVQVQEPERPEVEDAALPVYWRALTYDIYTGRTWRSSRTNTEQYPGESLARQASQAHSIVLGQRVELLDREASVVHAAGEIVSLDHDFSIVRRSSGDVFAVTAETDGAYRALSLVPVADEATLRAAGARYPGWVTDRFLQLPSDLPGRVRTLALELTATEETPYDRALQIERYLRQIPYTLDVERAPRGRDLVDFFLFNERRGYCDYYASAMTVLARAAGIPARLAIGYARGTRDPQRGGYLVSEAEAHSWVELYFPGVGWVPFEPTAGRPALDRTREYPGSLGTLHDSNVFFEPGETPAGRSLREVLLASLTAITALGAGALIQDELRLRLMSPLAATAEVHRRLRRLSARFPLDVQPGATPKELGRTIHAELQRATARSGAVSRVAGGLQHDLSALVGWMTDVQFRREGAPEGSTSRALVSWRGFWIKAHTYRLLMKLRALVDRGPVEFVASIGGGRK